MVIQFGLKILKFDRYEKDINYWAYAFSSPYLVCSKEEKNYLMVKISQAG